MGNKNTALKYIQPTLAKEYADSPQPKIEEQPMDWIDSEDEGPLSKALTKGILKQSVIASNNKLILSFEAIKSAPCTTKSSKLNHQRVSLDEKIIELMILEKGRFVQKATEDYPTKLTQTSESDINQQPLRLTPLPLSRKELFKPIQLSQEHLIKVKKANIKERYKFQEKIGEGGYGVVFKARCKQSNELRAIKILKIFQMVKEKKEMFLHQVKILLKMDHPSIIKVYQVIENNGSYYIVTEFCDGGPIDTYLKNHVNKYCEETIKKVMKKLLNAVSYIHQRGFLHRDLKLDNIVFKKSIIDGKEDLLIKIIDFGLAKSLEGSRLMKENKIIGTTSYLPPQSIEGIYTAKSDVWACGIILHTLLRGKLPFKGNNKAQIFNKIRQDNINFQTTQWSRISKEGRDLVQKMLRKSYQKRITVHECLTHPWFNTEEGTASKNGCILDDSIPTKLINYCRGNNLMAFVSNYTALTKVGQQEREELIRYFNEIDRNQNGLIEFFRTRSVIVGQVELQSIINSIDSNKNGSIDLNEFICVLADHHKCSSSSSLNQLFTLFDQNKDGFIEKKELKSILSECNHEEINYLINHIDRNVDQKISRQEFEQYLRDQAEILHKKQ